MRKSIHGIAVIFAAVAFSAGPMAAENFKLTYNFTFGSVLEADITGELQDDGDTVVVSAIKNARFDGDAGPALTFVTSLADLVDGTDTNHAVLTLSGLNNDVSTCSDNTCIEEFITFDGVKQFLGAPGIFTSVSYGSTYSGGVNAAEQYDPANYSLELR
ncbi:MAG: hypothetical protein GY947_23215 [Rhodobacteraceae bacterium]|nr:hypothetical protein [Paracoccaceae bacterium]